MIDNEQPIEGQSPTEAATDNISENLTGSLSEGLLGKVAGMLPEGALEKASDILPEGALDKAAGLLDRDGDGNPINDLAGFFLKRD